MGALGVDLALKRAIARGDVPGPRVVANGRSITTTGGHGHHLGREIDGPVDARTAVRDEVERGADFIKFMTTGGVTTPGTDADLLVVAGDPLEDPTRLNEPDAVIRSGELVSGGLPGE